MSTALLDGRTVNALRLTIPAYGLPVADIAITDELGMSTTGLLTVGTLGFIMSPVRAGSFMGSTGVRAVGGMGGWRQTIPAKGYQSAVGLQFAQIVGDAAREVAELVGPSAVAVGSVGSFYGRRAEAASQVFNLLPTGTGWWVDTVGVTQFGVRAPGLVTSPFDVVDFAPNLGKLTVMMDDTAALVPGLQMVSPLIGSRVINCVDWTVTDSKMIGEVWFD